MNYNQRRDYSAKHVRKMKRIESAFIKPVYEALQHQIKQFTIYLLSHGIDEAKNHLEKILINTEVEAAIRNIYGTLGVYSYKQTIRTINASAQYQQKAIGFGFDQELFDRIMQYFRIYLLAKAVLPITQTTKEQILAELEKGILAGESSEVIARRLENDLLTLVRARMIVRTESLRAMQYGNRLASSDSPWQTESEWISAEDARVRPAHQDVDGVKVPEGQRFNVPIYWRGLIIGYDHMYGPGDESASAGNVINCRCTLSTKAARDKNGRLIRKSNISVILPGEAFVADRQIITV